MAVLSDICSILRNPDAKRGSWVLEKEVEYVYFHPTPRKAHIYKVYTKKASHRAPLRTTLIEKQT